MMNGTIKTLKEQGFGFIQAEGQDNDIFFHSSALVGVTFDELREGDAVSFELEDSDKGPRAVNVQRAEEGAEEGEAPAEEADEAAE